MGTRARASSVLGLLGLIACARASHPSFPGISSAAPMEPLIPARVELVPPPVCPGSTVEVEGDYCPNAQERCLTWVDRRGVARKEAIPADGDSGRCGEFERPTRCLGPKVHEHYCIDAYEFPNVRGQVPRSWMTWHDVKDGCEARGERLCTKPEWTFACEGPEMHPLPYGDGYHRNSTMCNIDNPVPEGLDIFKVTSPDTPEAKALDALLKPSGSMPDCVSPFGVYDMVGNIDEFINNQAGHRWRPPSENGGRIDRGPFVSGLVSGHIFGVRNACRPMTPGHNEAFSWYETGGRCCADTLQPSKETIDR